MSSLTVQSNFLPIPPKRAEPLPTLPQHLLNYISTHFRDAHPEAFRKDVEALVKMRRDVVETKPEAHPEIVKSLMRYAQSFRSRFPYSNPQRLPAMLTRGEAKLTILDTTLSLRSSRRNSPPM